jgi:flagellar FliL protein
MGSRPRLSPEFRRSPAPRLKAIQDKLMASKPKKTDIESEVDDEDTEGEGAAPVPAKWELRITLKTLLIAAAALLVFGGGGAAAYFFLVAGKETKQAALPGKPVVFVDLPEILVNLANAGNDRTQYLKVRIVLEVPDQALAQQIQPVMPRVTDAFQTYLRELRPIDLDGSAGLYRLKEELTRRVNAAIAPSHINALLFKEIVVQ